MLVGGVISPLHEFETKRPRRRRWIRIALSAFVILAFGAGAAGSVWLLRRAPELTAEAIGSALGRKVEMRQIEVRLGWRVRVEVRELRVYETLQAFGDPLLEAPLARGYQSWPRVLLGQLVPQDWELDSPVARIRLDESASGSEIPAFPLGSLAVSDAVLEIDAGSRGAFRIDQLSMELGQPRLLSALISGVRGEGAGRISNASGVLGRAKLEFSAAGDSLSVSGRVDNVILSRVRPLLGIDDRVPSLRGRAAGRIGFEREGSQVQIELDLELRSLRAELTGIESQLVTPNARIAARIDYSRGFWRIRPRPLTLGDFSVRGELSVDPRTDGRVRAELEVADFSAKRGEAKALNLISLLGLRLATWRSLDERLLAGDFEGVSLSLDLPREGFWQSFAFPRPLAEDEFRFRAKVSGGVLETGPRSAPLESLSGSFALLGDAFRVEQLRVARSGQRYPELNLEIDGFARYTKLPPEDRAIPSGPGRSLPGIGPALGALRGDPDPATEVVGRAAAASEPLRIDFENLSIDYPGLLFQIRDARGRMLFPKTGLEIRKARAVIAGGLADLDISWNQVADRIDARIGYVSGPTPRRRIPAGQWLSAELSIPHLLVGPWKLRDVSTRLTGREGLVRFGALEGSTSGGLLAGRGELDLTRDERAPIRFQLSLKNADAAQATAFMKIERGAISGEANAEVRIDGVLDSTQEFMPSADLDVTFLMTNGTLVDLPIALQIARLLSLEGIRGLFGQALPYRQLSGQVLLRKGLLSLEDLVLTGPQLRALAAGRMDLNTESLESDLVVAILFLQTLDRVIGRVPLLGQMLLGDDGSLLSLGFRVRGPFASPSVTPATPETLQSAADWTGGWLRRVGDLIPGLRSGDGTEETPPAPRVEKLRPLLPAVPEPAPGGP